MAGKRSQIRKRAAGGAAPGTNRPPQRPAEALAGADRPPSRPAETAPGGGPSLQRFFPRRIDVLDDIFAFVAEFLAAAEIDRSAAFDLDFILEEMFTNMVKYNRGDARPIGVELERLGDRVRIRLTDAGVAPFDPSRLPAADTSSPLAERRVGGLGVHLVRRMAESLTYEHRDGTNIVTVVKRLEG